VARSIEYKLKVDSSGAVKSIEEVTKSTEDADKRFQHSAKSASQFSLSLRNAGSALSNMKGLLSGVAGAVGLGGLAFGLEDVVHKATEFAESVHQFHATTGIAAGASIDLVAALNATGIGAEGASRAFAHLGKAIQTAERQQYTQTIGMLKAHMTGKMYTSQLGVQAQAFEELGISLNQLASLSKHPQQQLELVFHRLEEMRNGMQKARIIQQLFGRGGLQLAKYLEGGALSLSHLTQLAQRFYPIGKNGAASLEEMQVRSIEAKMAWEGFQVVLATKLIPVLDAIIPKFTSVLTQIEHGQGVFGTLKNIIEGVVHVVKDLAQGLEAVAKAVGLNLHGALADFLGLASAAAGLHALRHPIKTISTGGKILKTALSWGKKILTAGGATGVAEKAAGGALSDFATAAAGVVLPAATAGAAGLGFGAIVGSAVRSLFSGGPQRSLSFKQVQSMAEAKENWRLAWLSAQQTGKVPVGTGFGYVNPFAAVVMHGMLGLTELAHAIGAAGAALNGQGTQVSINIDGRKVAEALAANPQAIRYVGEAAERAALQRAARR